MRMKKTIDMEQMKQWFLGTFGILISSLKIPFRNPNFITFTLISSFPLFFITLVARVFPLRDQLSMSFIKALTSRGIVTIRSSTMKTVRILGPQFPIVHIGDFINFLFASSTVCASSAIFTSDGDHKASMGLIHLLRNTISRSLRLNGVLTFIVVSMLHNICSLYVGYFAQRMPYWPMCTDSLIVKFVQVMTFAIWVEYNAWWKLSVVASFTEEQRGGLFGAFAASSKIRKGNKLRGFTLMFLLCICSDWPTLMRGHIRRRTDAAKFAHAFLQASLLCSGKVMTWMVFTVYYFDCKKRQ